MELVRNDAQLLGDRPIRFRKRAVGTDAAAWRQGVRAEHPRVERDGFGIIGAPEVLSE